MADRKAVMKPAPARPQLDELRERAKSIVVTEEMLNEQRISFAFGNAPAG